MIHNNLIMPVKDTEQSVWFESPRQSLAGMCFMSRRLTTLEFIERAEAVHGDYYDYSLVEYKSTHDKVKILCKLHGVFLQSPHDHIKGVGCPLCAIEKRNDIFWGESSLNFFDKAHLVHGDRYDYSLVEYKTATSKVVIICKKHGSFKQTPNGHLSGSGCPMCQRDALREYFQMELGEFIERAIVVHNNKYDYSLVEYVNAHTKVKIICPIHGEFIQEPNIHLKMGCGCPVCGKDRVREKRKLGKDNFIKRAIVVHGGKYDYSQVNYINEKTKVKILCHEHGVFMQTPTGHMSGKGCSKCKTSKGERRISMILENHNIKYVTQKPIKSIGGGGRYRYDFFIPDYNVFIEYHGKQHFVAVDLFGGENALMQLKKNDEYKKQYVIDNGFIFREYTYKDEWNYIETDILKTIKQCQPSAS